MHTHMPFPLDRPKKWNEKPVANQLREYNKSEEQSFQFIT